jgi:hypothetical protein
VYVEWWLGSLAAAFAAAQPCGLHSTWLSAVGKQLRAGRRLRCNQRAQPQTLARGAHGTSGPPIGQMCMSRQGTVARGVKIKRTKLLLSDTSMADTSMEPQMPNKSKIRL